MVLQASLVPRSWLPVVLVSFSCDSFSEMDRVYLVFFSSLFDFFGKLIIVFLLNFEIVLTFSATP